jgi:hypothetical protein
MLTAAVVAGTLPDTGAAASILSYFGRQFDRLPSYVVPSGDCPPDEMFKSLGLGEVTLVRAPAAVLGAGLAMIIGVPCSRSRSSGWPATAAVVSWRKASTEE